MSKAVAIIFTVLSLFSTAEAQALVCLNKAHAAAKALHSVDQTVSTSLMNTKVKSRYEAIDMTKRTIETYTFGIELKLVLISLDATEGCKLQSVKVEQYD